MPDDQTQLYADTADVQSREEQKKAPLFAGHVKVYPKKVAGIVRRYKWAALIGLLAIYYLAPWLRWDRGAGVPDQAILIDMPNRRAYFFFIEIWPQEVYYLTVILIVAALGLFLATSLFGRIWCGFTCPQTVWTDLFMWVERLIEGDRNARMRLDKARLSTGKVARKVSKHAVWLIIAFATGGAWVLYFQNAPTFVVDFFTGQAGVGSYFFVGLFTATTYLLAGWAREQVCTYMCPWPRFQAALLDEDSLVVTYQSWRGEPRGKHKRGTSWDDRGDCIDCKACVSVCPTGIDIRDGIQLECIGCGLCIDACNDIMDKVGRPRELITFDSERNQALAAEGKPKRMRIVRPRTIAYVVVLALLIGAMAIGLSSRSTLELTLAHDRSPLFVTLSDGDIRNGYEVRILNKTHEEGVYTLALDGIEGATMSIAGQATDDVVEATLTAQPDSIASYRVFVTVPAADLTSDRVPLNFILTDVSTGATVLGEEAFRGPEP